MQPERWIAVTCTATVRCEMRRGGGEKAANALCVKFCAASTAERRDTEGDYADTFYASSLSSQAVSAMEMGGNTCEKYMYSICVTMLPRYPRKHAVSVRRTCGGRVCTPTQFARAYSVLPSLQLLVCTRRAHILLGQGACIREAWHAVRACWLRWFGPLLYTVAEGARLLAALQFRWRGQIAGWV